MLFYSIIKCLFRKRLIRISDMVGKSSCLEAQIEVYLDWAMRKSIAVYSYREYLTWFMAHSTKDNVLDITDEDVEIFVETVYNARQTMFSRHEARKALTQFRKWYMARSKNGMRRDRPGRPANVDEMNRAYELKSKLKDSISFAEIGYLLRPKAPMDRNNVWKLYKRALALKGKKIGD